ncbi:MAG: hypothetical protein Q8W46_05440 [Candidatus Palauibacterales bacterium]|nr:hypothetical protein [Candidatus Palauibacterales bacterium]
MRRAPSLRAPRGFAALILLGLTAAPSVRAQDTPLDAQVEQIAGSDIYLGAGTDMGLVAGSILVVMGAEGDEEVGRLRVIEATTKRSITTFVESPFPVTRGAILRLRIEASADGTPPAAPAAGAAVAASPRRSSTGSSTGPRVSGGLGLTFDARETTTSWDEYDLESVDRQFSTPTMALRLGVAELPGGLDFRTNLRASYRASTDDVVQPQDFVRVYSLELRKDFGSVQASLGRLYNPYEPMSGYFDGAWVHVGGREGFGAGASAGLRPSREDGGISDSIPKYSVFANYSDRTGPLRYDAALSFTQEMPKADSLSNHSYIGLTQTLRTGPIRLSQSLAVDRDPTDDTWRVSRLLFGASAPIVGGMTAHARYSLRQPYRVEQIVPITYQRDRANLGLTYGFSGSIVGADVTADDVTEDGLGRSWTYSGWFSVSETPLWDLGFTGNVSYRDRDGDHIVYAMPGLTRRFGPTFARLTYTYYRTEEPAAAFTTHAGDLAVDFPLTRRLRGTLAGRVQRGAQLDANSIYVSLWWAF